MSDKLASKKLIKQLSYASLNIKNLNSNYKSIGTLPENKCNSTDKTITRILNTKIERSIWTSINMDTIKLLTKKIDIIIEVYKKKNSNAIYTGIGTIVTSKLKLNTENLFFNTRKSISSPKKATSSSISPLSKTDKSAHKFYTVNLKGVENKNKSKCINIPFEFCNSKGYKYSQFSIKPTQITNTSFGSFILFSIYNNENDIVKLAKDEDHFAMCFIKCTQPTNTIKE
jgi:hypothetical protein